MPPGIGTWSGGYQAKNSWHRGNGVSSVPPHPGPMEDPKSENRNPKEGRNPKSEGRTLAHGSRRRRRAREKPSCGRVGSGPHRSCPQKLRAVLSAFGSRISFGFPWPVKSSCYFTGRVSGFGSPRRRAAVAQNVFGTRETEPQFLAESDLMALLVFTPRERLRALTVGLLLSGKPFCLSNHLAKRQAQSIGNRLGCIQIGASFLTFQEAYVCLMQASLFR